MTDAAWEKVKGSAYWHNHPTRLKMEEMECELFEVREQSNTMREKWLSLGKCCENLGAELHEIKQQRDMLAKALDRWPEIREWLEMSMFVKGYMKSESVFFDGLSEALAAVRGGAK
jgi:hypothetical protein